MLKAVIFYNYYGHGDLFTSREFVKDYMNKLDAESFYYAHLRNPRILKDIDKLEYMKPDSNMRNDKAWALQNNILYINTWIGRDSKYVLPGIGCTVEQFQKMHNDIAHELDISLFNKHLIDYIPSIDYGKHEIEPTKFFIQNSTDKKILICNEHVQSSQAENFDFKDAIEIVANYHKDKLIFVTKEIDTSLENIIHTSDVTLTGDGFDLNEVSYLSLFCDVIIGRCSGAHVHTMVRENCMNERKINLSFTYGVQGGHFVRTTPIKVKKVWSGATDTKYVAETMLSVIDYAY